VTIGRMFSDTFAGIAPASAQAFTGMQIIRAAVGVLIVLILYPDVGTTAGDVVVPHTHPANWTPPLRSPSSWPTPTRTSPSAASRTTSRAKSPTGPTSRVAPAPTSKPPA
jgi:hypothetical protein